MEMLDWLLNVAQSLLIFVLGFYIGGKIMGKTMVNNAYDSVMKKIKAEPQYKVMKEKVEYILEVFYKLAKDLNTTSADSSTG